MKFIACPLGSIIRGYLRFICLPFEPLKYNSILVAKVVIGQSA